MPAVRRSNQVPLPASPRPRSKGNKARLSEETPTPAEQRAAMTWAQRLKRVFNIDIETCDHCGGPVQIIAAIEDPAVIKKILDHLKAKAAAAEHPVMPESRAPPQNVLFH